MVTPPRSRRVLTGMRRALTPAPKIITFRRASTAYVSRNTFEIVCRREGICSMRSRTPLRNIMGNYKKPKTSWPDSCSLVIEVATMPRPRKLTSPRIRMAAINRGLPRRVMLKTTRAMARVKPPWMRLRIAWEMVLPKMIEVREMGLIRMPASAPDSCSRAKAAPS